LAAYRATKGANPGNTVAPEFHAACVKLPQGQKSTTISHVGPVDPLVFPNMPNASHQHVFAGNTSTDENTTIESLEGNKATACAPSTDLSAYWVPELQVGTKDPA